MSGDDIPIWHTIVEACMLPFETPKVFLFSTALLFLALGLGGAVLYIGLADQPDFGARETVLVSSVVLLFSLGMTGYLCLWIRYGVFRDARAWSLMSSAAFRAAGETLLNLLWISALVGIAAAFALWAWSSALGLIIFPGLRLWLLVHSIWVEIGITLVGLPLIFVRSLVFARFSRYIVEPALGVERTTLTYPRDPLRRGVFRFAAVLFLISLLALLLNLILSPIELLPMGFVVVKPLRFLAYLYCVAVFGVANGLVFRVKTGVS